MQSSATQKNSFSAPSSRTVISRPSCERMSALLTSSKNERPYS